jgi:hypothetical protein
MQEWFRQLHAWHEFYTFAGTAAATLMGLMFVVMTLGQRTLATEEGSRATRGFFTPIVVFFATVILVAMIMLIPDTPAAVLGALLTALAVVGLVYMILSGAHKMWQTSELGYDDLIWYVVLPYVSYAAVGAAGAAMWKANSLGFYTAAGAMLLLLLIGIRNAWDLVIYNVQHSP